MNLRQRFFQQCNEDTLHQHLAGVASWAAFSARWRAHQGLPLLHPLDVVYLSPGDFHNGVGRPLSPTDQRRLYRHYVEQAIQVGCVEVGTVRRVALPENSDIAFVRSVGFQRLLRLRPDVVYGGRDDVRPYESEALSPTRPYGVPCTSETFPAYWLKDLEIDADED